MNTYLAHYVVMYLLPACLGLAAGLVFGGGIRRLLGHTLVCLGVVAATLPLQYSAYVVALGLTTGAWPDSLSVGGVLYALGWFCIPAVFTTTPVVVGCYALVTALRRGSQAPEIANALKKA